MARSISVHQWLLSIVQHHILTYKLWNSFTSISALQSLLCDLNLDFFAHIISDIRYIDTQLQLCTLQHRLAVLRCSSTCRVQICNFMPQSRLECRNRSKICTLCVKFIISYKFDGVALMVDSVTIFEYAHWPIHKYIVFCVLVLYDSVKCPNNIHLQI